MENPLEWMVVIWKQKPLVNLDASAKFVCVKPPFFGHSTPRTCFGTWSRSGSQPNSLWYANKGIDDNPSTFPPPLTPTNWNQIYTMIEAINTYKYYYMNKHQPKQHVEWTKERVNKYLISQIISSNKDHWDPDHHTLAGSRVVRMDAHVLLWKTFCVSLFMGHCLGWNPNFLMIFPDVPLISKWCSLWFCHDFHISHIFICFLWLPICPYDFTILSYDFPICSNDFHIFSYVFLMTFQPVPMMFLLFPILSYDCPIISYDIPILSFDCPMNLPAFPWWLSYDVPIVSYDFPCLPKGIFQPSPLGATVSVGSSERTLVSAEAE